MRIASVLPDISCATFNPDNLDDPKELDGTDVAVVKGEIGVAENGAIWIPQTVKYKAILFYLGEVWSFCSTGIKL